MSQSAACSWSDLHDLFSVVMCIDRSMKIVHASDTLVQQLPQTARCPQLSDVFDCLRPSSLVTFDEALKSLGSLCLLTATDRKFAIRGQLIRVDYKGGEAVCFCGAPWLFWINTEAPDIRLGLGDFSAQDVQLDQLFFMSTEKKMVEDLERLNLDLQAAKQQLEESQEAQRQFFAQMSHGIRTPLNGVVSAVALLEQSLQDPGQAKCLRLARSSSENLMQVINYVLSVSKLELSEQQEQTVFNWQELIQNTVDVVSAKGQQKALPIMLEFSSRLPQACCGSPSRLRQSLLNLLINAIKFTREGQVTVRTTLIEEDKKQCLIRLEVSDTGVGIAQGNLDKVFEPFWSATPAEIEVQEEGTGLGLDIVRRNVRSMGGDISVQSRLGEGTTFSLEIPVSVPQEPAKPASGDTVEQRHLQELAGHVLLVDDNETNRVLGELILESLGLEVATADCGNAAVAAVRDGRFDLVLMDINMPDIDGLEATRQIREFLDAKRLPIVALTAFVDAQEKSACLAVGMNDYLTKPIVREHLAEKLATWLSGNGLSSADKTDEVVADNSEKEGATRESMGADLLDLQVLHELTGQIGRDSVDLVVDKVKAEASERWQQLERAVAETDSDKVKLQVHSLASIFSSVGLRVIGAMLSEIEAGLRAGKAPDPGWLDDMRQLKCDSLVALEAELAAH